MKKKRISYSVEKTLSVECDGNTCRKSLTLPGPFFNHYPLAPLSHGTYYFIQYLSIIMHYRRDQELYA